MPPAAAAEPSEGEAYFAEEADMRRESGERAVRLAQKVKEYKKADVGRDAEDEATGIRYLAGRAFSYRADGTWVDMKYRSGMQLLRVRYLGQAYFELLRRSATLKKLLSLGERMIVVVGSNKAIEICPDGRDSVSPAELGQYLP